MIELTGQIDEKGTAHIFNRKDLDKWFVNNAGRYFTIKVERKKKKRSLNQNSYWWGVVVDKVHEGLQHLGHECSKEDTHEMLKARFNYKEIVNEETGEVLQMPLSTSDLSTTDFMLLIDKVQRFAAEFLNVIIPDPEQQLTIDAIICHRDEELKSIIVEPIK